MNGDRLAVIDLGSNTFHLLICAFNEEDKLVPLYKERIYVKLASGGLDEIQPDRIERGLMAMQRFAEQIHIHLVTHVRCIGTSALREANNGMEVVRKFSNATGLPIEIIDGQQEAQYILKGITSILPPFDYPGLIMDIGGGSVEFILYNGDTVLFKGSYKIGVAVLYRLFHHSDPMAKEEIIALEKYVEGIVGDLLEAMQNVNGYYLIGASGSFEVIHDVMPRKISEAYWAEMDMNGLTDYLDEVINTDIESRRQIPEIPIERLDYIVVAYSLIRYIFRKLPPEKLFYCDFALKEGVLAEMVESL
jgi:exopolyphosphatase/guanosine-5'-triphosphate,3'-diphosphate pyrophosphatase